MAKKTIENLGRLVKDKRGTKKLRETAGEIGIGPATLMRVENGHVPDLKTFGKICQWLEEDPGEFLGTSKTSQKDERLILSAHFRANRVSKPETINALAQMIGLVVSNQENTGEKLDA